MESMTTRVKHEIYVGLLTGKELREPFSIGYALKYDNSDYYIIKLWPLPGATYYMAKSRDGSKYTLFAKKIESELGVKFQEPIGFAMMNPEVKEYIEIFLRFPRQRVFMSVFPSK